MLRSVPYVEKISGNKFRCVTLGGFDHFRTPIEPLHCDRGSEAYTSPGPDRAVHSGSTVLPGRISRNLRIEVQTSQDWSSNTRDPEIWLRQPWHLRLNLEKLELRSKDFEKFLLIAPAAASAADSAIRAREGERGSCSPACQPARGSDSEAKTRVREGWRGRVHLHVSRHRP